MSKIDVASNTALLAVAEKLSEQNEILRGIGSGGSGGGDKLYSHRISMSDPDMGSFFVGHFYSYNNSPITTVTDIPLSFTPVNYYKGYGAGDFIPIGINPTASSLNLYGVDLDGGNEDEAFAGWAVVDNVTEV